jgi:hypothetical protein
MAWASSLLPSVIEEADSPLPSRRSLHLCFPHPLPHLSPFPFGDGEEDGKSDGLIKVMKVITFNQSDGGVLVQGKKLFLGEIMSTTTEEIITKLKQLLCWRRPT